MDPGAQKQLKKRESRRVPRDHFGDFATDWLKRKSREVAPSTGAKQASRLHKHLIPTLGDYRLTEITPRILFELGQEIQDRGAIETGNRVVRLAGQILQDAWVQGLIEVNGRQRDQVTLQLQTTPPCHSHDAGRVWKRGPEDLELPRVTGGQPRAAERGLPVRPSVGADPGPMGPRRSYRRAVVVHDGQDRREPLGAPAPPGGRDVGATRPTHGPAATGVRARLPAR